MVTEEYPAYLPGLEPGSMLAGYRLEAKVGAGGMAVVYRARDERLRRLVALKVLAPELVSDAAFRRRFIGESLAAAAVDDPHIIPVYEAGEANGMLFIAMRFVHGGDLRLVLHREGALAPARTAEFISPVASALDAAHLTGLVHRDVKPGNILVDTRPGRPDHVYLSDFGISKGAITSVTMAGPSMTLTGTGQFFGTPGYSAPEQIEAMEVDGRADQYALACVTYELLTGDTPFQRHSVMAVLIAHLQDPPQPLTSRRPDLPAAVDGVMAKALAKPPEDRYATCVDFADALRDALGLPPYHARGHAEAPPYPRVPDGSSFEPRSPAEPPSPIGSRTPTEISAPSMPRAPTEPQSPIAARSPTEISSPVAGFSPTGTLPQAATPVPVKPRTPPGTRPPTVAVPSQPIAPVGQPPADVPPADVAPAVVPAEDEPAAADPPPTMTMAVVLPAEPTAPIAPTAPVGATAPADVFPPAEATPLAESDAHDRTSTMLGAGLAERAVPAGAPDAISESPPAVEAVREAEAPGETDEADETEETEETVGAVESDEAEAGADEARTDVAGIDEAGIDEAAVDEAGIDEAAVDEAGIDEAGIDEAGIDEAGIGEAENAVAEADLAQELATLAATPRAGTDLPTIAGTSQDELTDADQPTGITPLAAANAAAPALADAVPAGTADAPPENVIDLPEAGLLGTELPAPAPAAAAPPEPELPSVDVAEPGLPEPELPVPDLAPGDLPAADADAVIAADHSDVLEPAETGAAVLVTEPDRPGTEDGTEARPAAVAPTAVTPETNGQTAAQLADVAVAGPEAVPAIAARVTGLDRGAVKAGKRQEKDWRRRLPVIAAVSALAGAAAVVVPLLLKSPAGTGHPPKSPGSATSASATTSSSHQTQGPLGYTPALLHAQGLTGSPVGSLAFNSAGTMLAMAGPDGLCVWDLSAGRCAHVFFAMFAVAFSPDGMTLAGVQDENSINSNLSCGNPDGVARLWNVGTGHQDASFCDTRGTAAVSGGALSVAFSPDGNTLAVGDGDGDTYLWNVRTGKPVAFVTRPGEIAVNEVAFSPDGTVLAVGDMNGSTYLWRVNPDTGTATFITVVTGIRNTDMNTAGVTGLAFSHDGSTLAVGETAATTHLTYLWNASTWKPAGAPLSDPGGSHVTAVAFAPDGSTLAVGDGNGSVYLWDTSSGTLLTRLSDPDDAPLVAVGFSSNGAALATSDQAGDVYYWSKSLASIKILQSRI